MADRPKVPTKVKRDVLFDACNCCAVCCHPLPLELAHIVAWCKTQDHSAENLLAMCRNCHARADNEKWTEEYLRLYKKRPCALRANGLPPVSAVQKMLIDLIIDTDPDSMSAQQRMRLVSVVAAFVSVSVQDIKVVSVTATNSSRVRLELPGDAAERLYRGFELNDPLLEMFFEEFNLKSVKRVPSSLSFFSRLKMFFRVPSSFSPHSYAPWAVAAISCYVAFSQSIALNRLRVERVAEETLLRVVTDPQVRQIDSNPIGWGAPETRKKAFILISRRGLVFVGSEFPVAKTYTLWTRREPEPPLRLLSFRPKPDGSVLLTIPESVHGKSVFVSIGLDPNAPIVEFSLFLR